MTRTGPTAPTYTDYLIVDRFLESIFDARALRTAFELGLIDRLEQGRASPGALEAELRVDPKGLATLVDLLSASGVVEGTGSEIGLSDAFRKALGFRDLLDAKLAFTGAVLADFVERFTAWVADPVGFQRDSNLFRIFDYGHGRDGSPESYEATRRWVRFTTALTRHEAEACLAVHDFGCYRRMLDVGGNSGEFALRLCRAHPGLRATVMDLPVVCQIGQEHVLPEPECERIGFLPGNALVDPLPAGVDLVTFKSMLHDWPAEEARRLLARATAALEPGGTLLVFERGPLDLAGQRPPLSALPILLFQRSYRLPSFYAAELDALGYEDIQIEELELDTPFFVVSGRKASPEPPPSRAGG